MSFVTTQGAQGVFVGIGSVEGAHAHAPHREHQILKNGRDERKLQALE